MGVGKTSLGRHIGEVTERQHLDVDQMIQQRLGRPIPQLFKLYGESAFRDHETSVLRSIQTGNAVISTGGGIVMKEANWLEMRRLGLVVFVDVSFSNLVQRLEISKKKRPLLDFEDWKQRLSRLVEERRPFYERADCKVDITGLGVEEAAKTVMEAIRCHL